MNPEELRSAIADIRANAGLPDTDYLEAELDKEGLMALSGILSAKVQETVK